MTTKARRLDRREAPAILSNPRWDAYLGAMPVQAMLDDGRLTLAGLRAADAFLSWAEARGAVAVDEAMVEAYCADTISNSRAIALRGAFGALASGDPSLRAFEKVARRKQAASRARLPKPAKTVLPPKARISVGEDGLPAAWRAAIADMRAGEFGVGAPAPAPAITKSVVQQLRQFAFSAVNADLPVKIDEPQLKVHLAAMNDRKLRAGTMMSALNKLLVFVRYAEPQNPILPTMRTLASRWVARAGKQVSLREQRAARLPDLAGIQARAYALLRDSEVSRYRSRAHEMRNAALALALPTLLPLRLADLAPVFDENIKWDGHAWTLRIVLSKSASAVRLYETRLDPWLTQFVDAVVLQGAAPEHLPQLRRRCLATRRHVFVAVDDKPCTYGYVSRLWKRHLGTGVHVVRSLVHDDLGAAGDHGVRDALLMCGQTGSKIAGIYQTSAHQRRAVAAVQAAVAGLLDDETLKAFE